MVADSPGGTIEATNDAPVNATGFNRPYGTRSTKGRVFRPSNELLGYFQSVPTGRRGRAKEVSDSTDADFHRAPSCVFDFSR